MKIILIIAVLLVTAQAANADSDEGLRSYTHPVYRWSITYPTGWTIDSADPDFVRISRVGDFGLCGIHSGAVRFKTSRDFTDAMEAFSGDALRAQGLTVRSLARRDIHLPKNVVGTDIVHDLLIGGKDRVVTVLAKGIGYTIDCETYAENWGKEESTFDQIIHSFTLGK